jgi:uncharacterized protein (DUF1778 family)
MMSRESSRTSRLEARITPDALEIVKRAAEIEGRSLSDFVVAAAREAAKHRLVDLLLDPPAVTPALERAREAHARLIQPAR